MTPFVCVHCKRRVSFDQLRQRYGTLIGNLTICNASPTRRHEVPAVPTNIQAALDAAFTPTTKDVNP
jgi:hypothetical protein